MAFIDLITQARAQINLPSASGTSDMTAITTLITACSRAIQRYCKRLFVQCTFDELYSGRGERSLYLRNYPINAITSVRYRPVTVTKITNNLANTPQARVSVTSTGITLWRNTNGTPYTDANLTFAGNVNIGALEAAVNAVGNGWSAVSQGYDNWPSGDLYCPNGPTVGTDYLYTPAGQGNLQCVSGSYAELKMHTYEMQGYQINERQGGLLRAIPYTDPELLHPEDLIWPRGVNNYRVQYQAGFTTIPEDVQEACAQLVAVQFKMDAREISNVTIPPQIAQFLGVWRAQTILMP